MLETLRTARGVMRSLGMYYGWHQRRRASAMDALYRRFVKRGDLVFDIGAHVGDRVAAFRRLGAKVVAVEPQPALASTLTMLYGRRSNVVIERVAVGRKAGDVSLMLNTDNPTISTVSKPSSTPRGMRRLAGPALGQVDPRADDDARRADRRAWRAGVHQDRRRGLRGRGADGANATGRGAVIRIHDHPA